MTPIAGRGGHDALFGDNVDFDGEASVGTAGGSDSLDDGDGEDLLRGGPRNDGLDGGPGSTDDRDGESGIDAQRGCGREDRSRAPHGPPAAATDAP